MKMNTTNISNAPSQDYEINQIKVTLPFPLSVNTEDAAVMFESQWAKKCCGLLFTFGLSSTWWPID